VTKHTTTPADDFLRGVWRENPVLVQALGLCPTLAVTNSVANSLAMSVATFFVLVGSSFLVSSFKRFIPNEVRISTYVLIIATFVTLADMSLEALVPAIHKALGAFVGLIIVNCIILARQEAFASRHPVSRSVLDAVGTGFGFTITMLIMGSIREVLGAGSFLGYRLFGDSFEPWVIFTLPAGGFFTLGFVLLLLGWMQKRKETQAKVRAWPEGVGERQAA
jgi:electron transport complex protein RnfE